MFDAARSIVSSSNLFKMPVKICSGLLHLEGLVKQISELISLTRMS